MKAYDLLEQNLKIKNYSNQKELGCASKIIKYYKFTYK